MKLKKLLVYNIKDILDVIPHKKPFLFVDYIIKITNEYMLGIKKVNFHDFFILYHYNVVPGVLLVEAISQIASFIILKRKEYYKKYNIYLLSINNFIFLKKIVYNDIIIFKVYQISNIHHNIVKIFGRGYIKTNILALEGELTAYIKKY